jgi:hypothetical protein
MVDTTIKGYDFSAGEVQSLTGWPDEMVEDYISILRQTKEILTELTAFDTKINANTAGVATNVTNIASNLALTNANFKYLHGLAAQSPAHSATATYAKYDVVTYDGNEYSARQAITPEAFTPAKWRLIGTKDNNAYVNEHIEAADPHTQYAMKEPTLILYGDVDNVSSGVSDSALVNYTKSLATQGADIANLNAANGTIEITVAGTYEITAHHVANISSPTANETVSLRLDIEGTKSDLSVQDVDTVNDDEKTFSATTVRDLSVNDTLTLFTLASASMGTMNTRTITFKVTKIA